MAVAVGLGMSVSVAFSASASAAPVMDVSSVAIEGNQHWSEGMIRRMVPSLNKSQIDVAELSKELQLVNDTGDETAKIFLSSKGRREGIDSDLAAFLDYIECKAPKGKSGHPTTFCIDPFLSLIIGNPYVGN